jgi:hypothetical protein
MNETEKSIVDNIEKFGCHVNSVYDSTGESPSFTYSTGISKNYEAPEIIIIGLPNKLAASVVNNYLRRIKEGETFEIGNLYPDFLANFDITFGPVSLNNKKEFLLSSCWFYNDEFEAVQLIFPTPSGIWPWDDEADKEYHEIQPSLAEKPEW